MKLLRSIISIALLLVLFYWLHAFLLIGVKKQSKIFYQQLKEELQKGDYSPSFFIISGKRYGWDNGFLSEFGNAVKNSKHLNGEAIDIIVLDVNQDGASDEKDVDIVFKILNEKIVKNAGGIGTYKKSSGFLNRQMVHFDCRGYWARWHK